MLNPNENHSIRKEVSHLTMQTESRRESAERKEKDREEERT